VGSLVGAIPLGLAGLTLVLVLINVWLVLGDQSRQAEVNQRQQYIEQSVRLGRVNASLVRALATAAEKHRFRNRESKNKNRGDDEK